MISNKLIGLAALVFLCGSASIGAVGCDDDATAGDDDDDDDAGTSGNTSSGGSSGRPSSSSGAVSSSSSSSGGGDVCEDPPIPTDLNGGYPKSSVGTLGSCSAANIQAMRDAANNDDAGTLTFDQLFDAAGATCKACFVTDAPDAGPWGLFAKAADGYYTNEGWCYGNVTGLPECGGTAANLLNSVCEGAACQACGTTDPDTNQPDDTKAACEDIAQDGCAPLYQDAITANCGGDNADANLTKGDDQCGPPAGATTNLDVWLHQINVVCGAGFTDGGL